MGEHHAQGCVCPFFLGLCAVVLLVHQNIAPEEAREETDPFIANLEAHVLAKAQRRLRAQEAKVAEEKSIAEARKNMQMMLSDAATLLSKMCRRLKLSRSKNKLKKPSPAKTKSSPGLNCKPVRTASRTPSPRWIIFCSRSRAHLAPIRQPKFLVKLRNQGKEKDDKEKRSQCSHLRL